MFMLYAETINKQSFQNFPMLTFLAIRNTKIFNYWVTDIKTKNSKFELIERRTVGNEILIAHALCSSAIHIYKLYMEKMTNNLSVSSVSAFSGL